MYLGLLFLALAWVPGIASGLAIYRFGGAAVAPPAEAGQEGVEFVQLAWSDLAASLGGEALRLDMDDRGIRSLEYDPQRNLAPAAQRNGGVYAPQLHAVVYDGDLKTVWLADRYLCAEFTDFYGTCDDVYGPPGTIQIYLGDPYFIDRIRMVSGLADPAAVVRDFRIHFAPQYIGFVGRPRAFQPVVVEVRDNREQYRDVPIPPHERAGFIQVALAEHNETWEVDEIEIYARGFAERSTYVSSLIDFGTPRAWGELRWSGSRGTGAQVYIQTRSGEDDDPALYWRATGRGEEKVEVSKAEYDKLKMGEKGGTTYDQDHWTFWSAPYEYADSAGTPIVSLSPRRFLQLKVDFLPKEEAGGEVQYLEFRASAPVASALVGEVSPVQAETGKPARFTYALRPTIKAGDSGFDRLELRTSSLLDSVYAVRFGGGPVRFTVEAREEHRLVVAFPKVEAEDSGALIEVDFGARVLRYGSSFEARVSDSGRPLEVAQGVNAGDATDAFEGNRVTVMTAVKSPSLLEARVTPRTFTPNGDGVNEVARISYDILEMTGAAAVRVEIWDLAGRLVRQVYAGEDGIGHYQRVWGGADASGARVAAGVYLYRVCIEADRERAEKTGVLNLVY